MADKSICRIGVFYDGSFFTYSQNYFYSNREVGWLRFRPFHELIESVMRDKEQGFANYKIVYAGWYQGLYTSTKATFEQLKKERNRHHDLMHCGIEVKYIPMSETKKEKGIDVALAVDAMQIGLEDKIDIAALVTGDADFVPLVRALMKQGVRVLVVYFDYKDEKHRSFANERLLNACNYSLNINELEKDKKTASAFNALFRKYKETD